MRHTLFIVIATVVCTLFLYSCGGNSSDKKSFPSGTSSSHPLAYARQFAIEEYDSYTKVYVRNPWKEGEIHSTYYLVESDTSQTPKDGVRIQVPVKSMVVNSSTYLGFLELLGELDKVTGICNSDYVYNPTILDRVGKGEVKDLGDSYNLNIEQLISLHPDMMMTSAYEGIDENGRRIGQAGIPVVYNIEWQEDNLLARAEWIKFIGAFFDKSAQADSIFTQISSRYQEAKDKLESFPDCPTILSGQDYRGSWSMPAGKSYTAQLFRDAGGCYYYANDSIHKGSIPTTMEEALLYFSEADVWVGTQVNSLKELAADNAQYKLFKSFKEGNVYNYNNRSTPKGGNDYWETAVARPDLLLYDMIKMLHPESLPEYELTFAKKLK